MTDRLRAYLAALEAADRPAAIGVARAAVEDGEPLASVLLDLVCRAQSEVGRLWQGNEWNVAREHAATAISEAVVGALTADVPTPARDGHVVVACVEGEWHALPARVVAEILRLQGWATTFLGASTPPAHLAQYLHDTGPHAVALSCSVATALPQARRMIEASREAGVPVVVGGLGFGVDDLRARRLGANGWALHARDAEAALTALPSYATPPPRLASPGLDEYVTLSTRHASLLEDAYASLARRFAPLAGYSQERVDRTREDIGHILEFLAAALFVDDDRVFDDFARWLRDVLSSRSVPAEALVVGLESVAKAVPDLPRATVLISAAVERVATPL